MIVGITQHRSGRKQLVERERAMKDVPADEAELAFQVERREDLAGEDALLEIRGAAVDRLNDDICRGFLLFVPAVGPRQHGIEMLAEEARNVRTRWSEPGIDGGGDQHLDDGFTRKAFGTRIEIRALHVAERRCEDDPRTVVRLSVLARRAGKIRELGERDVHAERPRRAAPALNPRTEFGIERLRLDQTQEEQLGVDSRRDRTRLDLASVRERNAARAPGLHPHRVDPEHRLDGIALEPVIEELAGAAGYELPQVALRRAGKAHKPCPQA